MDELLSNLLRERRAWNSRHVGTFGARGASWASSGLSVSKDSGFCHERKSKMAAELSTLVSSYLDQDPERYGALLLECLDSRQLLRDQVRESMFLTLHRFSRG